MTSNPGVYRMIDSENKVIYVGKAKNLKNRVSSYFRTSNHSTRIKRMISLINKVDIPQCLQILHKEVNSIASFVLWHYKTGSKFDGPFWNYVKTLPFTPIEKPIGEETYGQWGRPSFDVWENNT